MHRFIMNATKGMEVDHIDHNGLNNQKSNLRNCTKKENTRNRRAYGKSQYRGVDFHKGQMRARIGCNGQSIHIGYFKTEKEAALVYDLKAKELFGDFAYLNFK